MSIELTNLLRIGVMVMGVYILVIMGIVIGIYCKNLKTSSDRNRRILTGHIILIGTSYGIFICSAITEMMLRYDLPSSWRTPSCLFATLLGMLALNLMLWRLMLMRKIHPK